MKKIIGLLLTTATIFTSVSTLAKDYPQKFWDVPKDHWAFEYVADLADRNVINGYEDGSFKPERTVTRAEWAKIMVDIAGVSVNDNSVNFTDMSNHWANKYVNAAKNYLTGYADGSYRPNQAAVREDVTVAMVKLKGYDLSDVDYSVLSKFTDNDSISAYAKGYVAVAISKGLIEGFDDKTFKGQATLTRAEAATLLYRAFQKGSADKVVDISSSVSQTNKATPKPSATPKPTATPKPSATPKPTATPKPSATPKSTATPKPTTTPKHTPIPTEAPKPYVMKKLASANIDTVAYSSTYDYNESIYYIDKDDNCIYKINVSNGKKTKILDTSDLSYKETEEQEVETVETVTKTVETGEFEEVEEEVTEVVTDEETGEETTVVKTVTKQVPITKEVTENVTKTETEEVTVAEYNSYVPTQVYYDKENDRLLLWGYYTSLTKTYNGTSKEECPFLYDISNNKANFLANLSDYGSYSKLLVSLGDSRLVMLKAGDGRVGSPYCNYILDYETKKGTKIYMPFYSTSGLKYGNNLYSYVRDGQRLSNGDDYNYRYPGIYKYDFNGDSNDLLSNTECKSYGIRDDSYYFWKDDGDIFKISVRNGEATQLSINTKSDNVEFSDMGNMNNIDTKFYVVDDDTLVFYDSNMLAFRILSKNN